MYRVHNTTNSPFQIDTATGTTIVPAHGSAIADLTEDQRVFLDEYPDYRCEPVEYGSPTPAVKESLTVRNMHNHNDAVFRREVIERQDISEPTEENTRVASPEVHAEVDAIVSAHKASERDHIIAELKKRGIEFDGRMGVKKLRNLLRANS